MSEKLKIYACSGVEDQSGEYNYWTDNTNVLSNTQAVNTLLALINRNFIEVNYLRYMTPDEKIANLNDIDVYVVSLYFAEHHAEHYKQLERAGRVIGTMMADGAFDYDSLDNGDRDSHLDDLLQKAKDMFDDEMPLDHADKEFVEWFDYNIVKRNKVGLSKEEQERMQQALEKTNGVGVVDEQWMKDKRISEYLLKAGTYFLYTYLTPDQLSKLPGVFKIKKKKQLTTYNYCKQVFVDVYGSEDEMRDIIYSGIVKQFGETPDKLCEGFVSGKKPDGIGFVFLGLAGAEAVKALIEILTLVATVLGTLITAICSCIAQTNIARYGAIDKSIVNSSVPNPEDFDEIDPENPTKKISWLPFAAIGAGLLLLLRKSN